MDIKRFVLGALFLIVGYIMYRFVLKDRKPSSKDTNWEGMTIQNYIGLWGCVIMFMIFGVIFILESLPTQI